MPTGNEFSDVRFGQSEQSYKQTDREMSGGVDGQASGPLSGQSAGNYPNTFDRQAGSEPLGEQSDENPFYYPEKVFDYIKCSGPGQSYVNTERESISGEYGACEAQPTGPYPGTDIVPSPSPSPQFSSKMSGNPEELLNSTRSVVQAHADLINSYGFNMPVATMGSHPWLRDGLADPGESEPSNAEPKVNFKIPKRQSV